MVIMDRPRDDDERGEAAAGQPGDGAGAPGGTPAELPIDGTLDLHMFQPREARDLVRDYLDECLRRGILEVRIVHGKGIGVLRRIVQGVLDRHPAVTWYGHASDAGSWGATLVRLRPPGDDGEAGRGDGEGPDRGDEDRDEDRDDGGDEGRDGG